MNGHRINQALYQLFLGVWFGAMVMLVLAATAAFGFVRDPQTTLLVQVEGFGAPLTGSAARGWVAGGIVGAALRRLEILQLICFAGVAAATVLQCTLFRARLAARPASKRNGLRIFLLVVPAAIVLFNLAVVAPGIDANRSMKYDPAAEASRAQAADEAFAFYHGLSTKTYGVSTLMLLGAVVLGPWCFHREEGAAGRG
ncbi:hypothetical protein [Phycisphaera mikurensis]|uniref:DUF4149 domain-containing protein n=1 Tax=Phycisphaera mikurensis (strain NBRC 102666 / KCTC 22515 / FYK2301M01) TaxID=1142394 RepID=I0IH62_PHYMF|nr:hypothetical protein [Phycisphaera mikurensis]MBB6440852.1 hypothetical protein [Phycisphaera mikurensis]BAM04600.1 hypothetical protein PSMK_24410 [Phycisphaera mikurensis NBRC 102666]